MRRFSRTFALFLAVLFWVAPVGASEPPDPDAAGLTASQRRATVIARSAWEHERLETLVGRFVQLKESVMLLEPERSEGEFSYRSPSSMRWDHRDPETGEPTSSIVLHERTMTTWYHDLGEVEKVDVGRRADKVLKLLGPGASLADLERTFEATIELPAEAGEPYRVELEPRSARVGRRLRSLYMEIDRELFLPTVVRLTDPEGGITELRFDQMRINDDLPAGHFEPEFPADTGP